MSGPAEFTHAYGRGHDRGAQLVTRYGGRWPLAWQTTVGSVWADVHRGLRTETAARHYLVGLWHGVIDARGATGF